MVTIIYLEENGISPVLTDITLIAQMGIAGNKDAMELAKYIRQGLSLLATTGVPSNYRLTLESQEENGDQRTFQLLKELKHVRFPLFEFRVNRSTPGAFRAIFFEYMYEGEQLLVFTRSLLKQGNPNPPLLQQFIQESEDLYDKFHKNPEAYLGEDE